METKTRLKKEKDGYGYKYTELKQINEFCEENNIRYYQEIETCEHNLCDYMVTYVSYDDGEFVKHRGCKIVDAVLSGIKNPVQEYGSALTYCRRYSLLMALGLATEDNDANDLTIEPNVDYKIGFGKYAGKTLKEIFEENKSYIDWLYGYEKTSEYEKRCIELLDNEYKNIPEKLKLMGEIKIEMNKKKIYADEIYDVFGKKSNEMTLDELKEVRLWVDDYVLETK